MSLPESAGNAECIPRVTSANQALSLSFYGDENIQLSLWQQPKAIGFSGLLAVWLRRQADGRGMKRLCQLMRKISDGLAVPVAYALLLQAFLALPPSMKACFPMEGVQLGPGDGMLRLYPVLRQMLWEKSRDGGWKGGGGAEAGFCH